MVKMMMIKIMMKKRFSKHRDRKQRWSYPPSSIYDAINIKLDQPVIDKLGYLCPIFTKVPQGLTVYSEDGEVEMTANPVSDCDDDFHGCLLNLKENENV